MSAFLAPIHTWLFNKIILAEELEISLNEVYIDKYNEAAKDIVEKSLVYGSPIDTSKNIEDIIDKSNIHGWLQDKISKVETRTAFIITEMIKNQGQEAEDIAIKCFIKQGKSIGETLRLKEMPENPEELYNALNVYLLEGMPCDRVTRVVKSEVNVFILTSLSLLSRSFFSIK